MLQSITARDLLLFLLTSGLLFFGILLVKRILDKKLSPSLQLALWFLLIFKMFVPFGIPAIFSPWNLLPAAAPANAAGGASTQTFGEVFPVVWIAGVACMAVWYLFSGMRVGKLVRSAQSLAHTPAGELLLLCKEKYGVRRSVRLLSSSQVSEPYLVGVFSLRLLIPDSIKNDMPLLDHVLAHELAHVKRGDYLLNLLLNLLNAVYWFNPFLWLAFPLIRKDIEACCDQKALRFLGKSQREAYIGSILRFNQVEGAHGFSPELGFASPLRGMQSRVVSMFKAGHTPGSVKTLAIALAALLALVCFTTAYTPAPKPDPTDASGIPAVSPDPSADSTPSDLPSSESTAAAVQTGALAAPAHPSSAARPSPSRSNATGQPYAPSADTAEPPASAPAINPPKPAPTLEPPVPEPTLSPEPQPVYSDKPVSTGPAAPSDGSWATPAPTATASVNSLVVIFKYEVTEEEARLMLANYGLTVESVISPAPGFICHVTWQSDISESDMAELLLANPLVESTG